MVSIRKAKKAEKMQAKLNAENNFKETKMSLDEAYSLVDKIYKNPDAVIDWRELKSALEIIGASDAHFAAEMKKDFELREAYQIAGGYYQYGQNALQKTMDKRFQQALKLIEADDPEFAKAVRNLSKEGVTFKKADSKQLLSAEQVAQNAQVLSELSVAADVDMSQELAQTPVNGLSSQEATSIVANTAKLTAIQGLTEDTTFNQADAEQKHNMFVSYVKGSMKRLLVATRLQSGSKSIKSIKSAFSFKNKIAVSPKSIVSAYEKAQDRTSAYIKSLSEKGYTKASAFLNKAKTRVQSSMVKLATASVLVATLLPGCSNNNPNTPTPAPQQKKNITVATVQTSNTQMATDSVAVPTVWADSLGISKGNWKANQTFLNYEKAYKKITDEMLQKSGLKTRDQFLDAYRILRSFYPKVVEKQGNDLLKRSTTSEKFSQFFNNDDCVKANQFTAEDFAILKDALNLRGSLDRRATQEVGVKEDCAPGKVKYVNGAVSQKGKTNVETVAPVDSVKQQPVVSDTIPQFTFEETGQSTERVEVKNDTVALSDITVYKGNDVVNGQKTDSISAHNLTNATVKNKKGVLVEKTGVQNAVVADFVEEGTSRVDTTATQTFDFVEEGASRVDTTATQTFSFVEEGKSTVVTADADSIQVVEDSADLPVGTPSAGYVAERGGVNNTGLTAKQLQYSKSKIMATYGTSAYDDLMEGISDEMLSKGNIFEGLTREQAIYNLSVWSVSFPHSAETSLIYDYVLNCHKGEKMSQEDMAKAKAAMDRVRENKTIDGVTYNKPVYVKNVKNMGCDKKVRVNSAAIEGAVSPKSPSGPKFTRLFGLKPQRPEGFLELGASHIETERVVSETKPLADITVHKANDLDGGEKIGEMNISDVKGKVSNRKNVMVENTKPNKRRDAKKAKNLAEKRKQDQIEALKKYVTDPSRLALLKDSNTH